MQRLIKFTSFLLLAIWLPATLHCAIEAAGFATPHHTDCCAKDNDCKADLCANVESSLIKESAPVLDLAAHVADGGVLYLTAFFLGASERLAEPNLALFSQAPPLEFSAGWQFLTRAAPPARAPSLLLA